MTAEAAEEERGSLLYYTLLPAPGVRIVVLDGYDVSYSWPAGTERGDLARKMLAKGRERCGDGGLCVCVCLRVCACVQFGARDADERARPL